MGKLPFWLVDGMLLTTAAVLVAMGSRPLRGWEMLAVVACVGVGAVLVLLPYLREYDAALRWAEGNRLTDATVKLGQLEMLTDRVATATGQWQGVQDRAQKTAEVAQGIVDRLAREAEAFATVVSRTADGDKQKLKLEVDKLRKAEVEWVQAVARIMDHVFALHVAAVRSGQPKVAEQIDRFHGACREALRRVGMTTVVAAPDEPFDGRKHQTVEGTPVPEGARVEETVAPGFVFQGQWVRPVMVRLAGAVAAIGSGKPEEGTPVMELGEATGTQEKHGKADRGDGGGSGDDGGMGREDTAPGVAGGI